MDESGLVVQVVMLKAKYGNPVHTIVEMLSQQIIKL